MKKIVIPFSVIGMAAAAMLVFAAEDASQSSASTTGHKVLTPADLSWGEPPPGLPAGAQAALLNGNPGQSGPFTVRLKAPRGYKIMPHTHPTMERVTVITGTFRIGMGEKFDQATMQKVGPGGYVVLPAGMAHFAMCGTDSIIQVDGEGPFEIKYVNPADDPRGSKP